MANVKFLTGTETNLLKKNSDDSYVNPIREGSLYVTAERVSGAWISNLYYDTATERIKVSDTFGKAMYDHMNHNIAETYIMQITMEGSKYASTDGATLTYTKGSGVPTTILLPLASETTAGTVNTGAQTFAGNKTFKGRVILQGGNDTAAGTANTGALIVGSPAGAHISIDANEIQGKANGTSAAQLHINNDGGATQFGGNIQPKTDNALTLGTESLRWKNIYGVTIKATTFNGALIGNVTGALIGNAATADKWYTARTLTLGSDLQGSVSIDGSANVTLNASHYNVSCDSGNKSNYPWHRIATTGAVTGTHNDKDMTIVIRHTYKGGGYGLAKVSLRTDASGTASSADVRWLYRYNIDKENLQIGLRNTSGNTLADLYYKVGTWARCKIYQVEGSRTWTLISSNEVNDTTTSNKKTSKECYLSVADGGTKLSAGYTNTIKAVDGGIVERANNATLADKATSDGANHAILSHYIANIAFDGVTNKSTKVVAKLFNGDGSERAAAIDFPTASATQAGAITTGSQTLTGAKIIDANGSLEIKGSSKFNFSGIGSATSGSADNSDYIRHIWFSHAIQKGIPVYNDGFKFDPKASKVWDELTSEVSDKVVYTLETLKSNTRKNFNRVIADIFQGIAVKAYADIGSRPLATHYLSDISYLDKKADTDNVSKVVTVLYSGSGAEKKKVDFPTASSSTAGVVTIDSQTFAGNKTFTGRVYIKNSSDAGLSTADSGALVIGDKAGEHIIIDSNEIMGKSNGTTSRELLFQWDGGNVGFGGMVLPKTDKTSSVGSSSRRWGTVFTDTVNASKELKTAAGTFYANSTGNGYFGNSVGIRVAPDDNYALKVTGNVLFNNNLSVSGWVNSAGGFGVNSTVGDGRGLSLYNGTDGKKPTYGIFFAKTATFGKIGGITSDWATYFSMSDTAGRGWQFMRGSLNVMAIDTAGSIYSYFGPPTGYTATDVFHKVGTAKRTIGLCAAVSGNSGIYDYTKNKWMIYTRENVGGVIKDKKLALGEDVYAYNIFPFYSESHTAQGGDNQYDLGSSGNKWRNLYIGTSVVSSLATSTHLAGNQGKAIIYSTAAGNGYNMLARMKSTNGVWTFGSYGTNFNFYYTADSTINANSNSVTKTLTLLNESGNSTFPGQITATKFVGPLQGNATTATTLATARKINGTSFNGSGDITTSFWGTTRVFTISDSRNTNTGPQVNVNGSGNVNILLPATINANVVGNITGNVTGTSGRPSGFASSSSNATWGNQTGTTIVCWNDDAGGSIDWRKNNPSSGKLSIKVDGRVYVNEGNTPVATLTKANSYWGMGDPDGNTSVWIRTTTQGILPYQAGSVGGGHQFLGTSNWYFSASYIDKMWTKNVHIKETNTTEGVELKYNATNDYLEFVFIS